tara:strand:- start:636 stop:845 length:210 start_codon:yes stop_codon:yes gene_type:complete
MPGNIFSMMYNKYLTSVEEENKEKNKSQIPKEIKEAKTRYDLSVEKDKQTTLDKIMIYFQMETFEDIIN